MSRSYNDELQYLDKLNKNSWRIKKGFVPNMNVSSGRGVLGSRSAVADRSARAPARGARGGGWAAPRLPPPPSLWGCWRPRRGRRSPRRCVACCCPRDLRAPGSCPGSCGLSLGPDPGAGPGGAQGEKRVSAIGRAQRPRAGAFASAQVKAGSGPCLCPAALGEAPLKM